MPPDAPALISRILWHLSNNSEKLCWSGTIDQREMASVTWWTVSLAWEGATNPAEAARRHVMGERLEREAQLLADLEKLVPASKDASALVEGRSARRWVNSITRYLDWRIASAQEEFVATRLQAELQPLTMARWLVCQASSSNAPVHFMKEDACDVRRVEIQERPLPATGDRQPPQRLEGRVRPHRVRARLCRTRSWRTDLGTDMRAARSCRAPYQFPAGSRGKTMSGQTMSSGAFRRFWTPVPPVPSSQSPSEKLQGAFRELAESGVSMAALKDCFAAKLSLAARKQYGRNELAGKALGVCAMTLCRWNVAGRALPIGGQTQATVGRIAGAFLAEFRPQDRGAAVSGKVKPVEAIFAKFEQGVAKAVFEIVPGRGAAGTSGKKKAAAKVLKMNRNVFAMVMHGARRIDPRRTA
jgi:hypothetical protein